MDPMLVASTVEWMRRAPRLVVALSVLVLLVAAGCSSDKKKEAATATTKKLPPPTTPTTEPGPGGPVWPLTGLPLDKPDVGKRPALVVKIDNAPKARPPSGINRADVVVEEKVEDGVTRFFSIYHSQDADPVGPVRSARTTDITLVTPLNRPLFAYSGTNATFQRLINAAPLVDVGIDHATGEYRRDRGRPAPYNLFSSTGGLYRHAPPDAKPPPQLFRYRYGAQAIGAGVAPAGHLHVEYRGQHINTIVDWAWDAASGTWRRTMDGAPHTDSSGQQVSPRNVVVQFVNYRDTGAVDRSGTHVPEAELIGQGDAWVLSDGKIVRGRWSKPSPDAVTAFTGPDGQPLRLTPGQTWLELPPPGSTAAGP